MINAYHFCRYFTCYRSEEIRKSRQLVGYFFWLSNKIDTSEWSDMIKLFPHAERWKARPEYAPELVSDVVFVPSAAEVKRRSIAAVVGG